MTEELENVIQEIEPVPNANESVLEEPKKMFPSDVVKKVVDREKSKAFERGKREALMELQQQQQQQMEAPQQQGIPPQQPQQNVGLGGMKQVSEADIERMITERAPLALQQHVQKLQKDQMVNTFVSKMQLAEQQYPGLEAELNELNYDDPRMHTFIALVNQLDNTGDVMKEALDNPGKMEHLLNMSYTQPYQAQKAFKSLSDSIKTNQNAKADEAQARDPLSQIKSSTTSGNKEVSQHDMSTEDIRKLLVKKFK